MLWDFDAAEATTVTNRRSSDRLLEVVQESLKVETHGGFLAWLQGPFQAFLPHEILLVAWGDSSRDTFQIDVTSSLEEMRTRVLDGAAVRPFVHSLLDSWTAAADVPCSVPLQDGLRGGVPGSAGFNRMRHALVHGIRNQRDQQICLYILLRTEPFPGPSRRHMEVLLPYMDAALRKIDPLPIQNAARGRTFAAEWELSERECDVLQWVAAGKTNEEIGLIMEISPFTVKNHLRRIFQKLDVSNRAQAVDRLSRCPPAGPQGSDVTPIRATTRPR